MTRGKMVLITPQFEAYTTTEFNGDMYWEGYGKELCPYLIQINDLEAFKDYVEAFNSKNFDYDEELIDEVPFSYFKLFGIDTYFTYWFSDYLYIKNACPFDIIIKDYNGNDVTLKRNVITILCFGDYYGVYTEGGLVE